MKNSIKITGIILFSFLISVSNLFAQQDTTRVQIGKKKLIIVDDSYSKEKKIADLESGKKVFKDEIENADEDIKKAETEIEILKTKLSVNGISEDEKTKISDSILFQEKIIEESNKKIESFEKGITEIDNAIIEFKKNAPEEDKKSKHLELKSNFDKYNGHWAGFDLGLNNYLTKDYKFQLPSETEFMKLKSEKSYAVHLNFWEYNLPITEKRVGLTTGAGIEWNSFSLYENITLKRDNTDVIIPEYIDEADKDFSKNKLNTGYLTIPVLFEIQSHSLPKQLYFSFGVIGGLKLWSKQKQVYTRNNNKFKTKTVDDFQINPFRYSLTARVGYGHIRLFADYNPVALFKKSYGPELYPVTVGITLLDF